MSHVDPFAPPGQPIRAVGFASGRGSNLAALLDASAAGRLPMVEWVAVVSNNPAAPALDIARRHGIPALAIDHRPFRGDRAAHERAILAALAPMRPDWAVLAGYMRLLTPTLIDGFGGRMVNIHPSLLPAFPGVDAQGQALAHGVRHTGCTVHLVTPEMDAGPIILQRVVPVRAGDDHDRLAARILAEEHRAFPQALDLIARGRVRVAGRRTRILPGATSFPELEGDLPLHHPVVFATGNAHKVEEVAAILAEAPVVLAPAPRLAGVADPEETAPDYLGNARIKAAFWAERTGRWALADDSGLEVDALDGRPGVHSSRYAPTTPERNARLLAELDGVSAERRRARFVCTVVLRSPDGEEYHATGRCEGAIGTGPRGEGGFGYDPLFIPDGFDGRHLAELPAEVKNQISHRARALQALRWPW